KVCRGGKAIRVEPFVQTCDARSIFRFLTFRHDVGARSSAKECSIVGLSVAEHQGKAALECGDAVDAPAANYAIQGSSDIRHILLPLPEGQVQYITDHQTLRYILR